MRLLPKASLGGRTQRVFLDLMLERASHDDRDSQVRTIAYAIPADVDLADDRAVILALLQLRFCAADLSHRLDDAIRLAHELRSMPRDEVSL